MKSIRYRCLLIFFLSLLFFISRGGFLYKMPIINDEPLYVDYMITIKEDWDQNKRISVDNIYGDWKPPLQYWYGSLFLNVDENPIYAARWSSVMIGFFALCILVGLVFLLTKTFSYALFAGFLYVLNPIALSNNTMVMAEGLVSFFLLSSICILYYVASLINKPEDIMPSPYKLFGLCILYILTIFGLLYSKQTGDLFAILQLPFLLIFVSPRHYFHKKLLYALSLIIVFIVLAYVSYKYSFPIGIYDIKHLFSQQYSYTFGIYELLSLPLLSRLHNGYSGIQYVFAFYGGWIVVIGFSLLVSTVLSFRRKDNHIVSHFFQILCIVALISLSFILLIKNFPAQGQKVIQYSAELFTILITLSLVLLYTSQRSHKKILYMIGFLLCMFSIFGWIRNLVYNSFIEYRLDYSYAYKTQQCMVNKDCNRGSHIDMDNMLDTLQKISIRGGNYCVITDPQWGHPGTLVKVVAPLYDNLISCGDMPYRMSDLKLAQGFDGYVFVFDSKRADRGETYGYDWGLKWRESKYCSGESYTWTKGDSTVSHISLCLYTL